MHVRKPCKLSADSRCYFLYLYYSLAQVGLLGMAMGPYVDSTWGVAQFSVPNETPCMCAFIGDKKTVVGKC